MSCPPSATRPWVGGCSPQMTLNNVVLPAPFGPMRPVTWPTSTRRSTSSSARTPPNSTETSATSRTATQDPPNENRFLRQVRHRRRDVLRPPSHFEVVATTLRRVIPSTPEELADPAWLGRALGTEVTG